MKFVDLFAGLGGFHLGFANSGKYECVFASEVEPELRRLYRINFGIKAQGDIKKIDERAVPPHDVLCAGFPCQPFSLAGLKKGSECPSFGKLIDNVVRIAKHRTPEFLVLENVPGLMTIADGSVWKDLKTSFGNLGYTLIHKVISPFDLGIPHNRKRLFIIGSLNCDLSGVFDWPSPQEPKCLKEFLSDGLVTFKTVEPEKSAQLDKWQQLLSHCKLPVELPCMSISSQEFGATYPLDFSNVNLDDLKKFNGAYGKRLSVCRNWSDTLMRMPSYCRKSRQVPDWLRKSVEFSRDIYKGNKNFLDKWHVELNKDNNSWQLLEWRGFRKERLLDAHLLQFRASGIRVLKPNAIPSLISMTPTQVPIIGSQMRYLSKHEAARLQNLHELYKIPDNDGMAFKALGNAVNARIVELIATNIKYIRSKN